MKTEIEDIIRSTLVIQNKQSLGLCVDKIIKYIESDKIDLRDSDFIDWEKYPKIMAALKNNIENFGK